MLEKERRACSADAIEMFGYLLLSVVPNPGVSSGYISSSPSLMGDGDGRKEPTRHGGEGTEAVQQTDGRPKLYIIQRMHGEVRMHYIHPKSCYDPRILRRIRTTESLKVLIANSNLESKMENAKACN